MSAKSYRIIFLGIFLSGCAATPGVKIPPRPIEIPRTPAHDTEVEIPVISIEQDQEPVISADAVAAEAVPEEEIKGIVFGKTDFQGLLKTSFVKLFLEGQGENTRKLLLYIGEDPGSQTLPWEFKKVEPGYFLVELPVGRYKVTSISIPVGSTLATEEADLSFEVLPEKIVYLGTINMNGTKEKIKLGGVPVIKPGFEYSVKVLNQQDEGVAFFRGKYPNISAEILMGLIVPGAQEDPAKARN